MKSNRRLASVGGVACAVTFLALSSCGKESGPDTGKLVFDVSKEAKKDFKDVDAVRKRHVIELSSTSQDGLLACVGLVLIVDSKGGKATVYDPSQSYADLRPSPDELKVVPLNQPPLYEGKVTGKVSVGGNALIVTASASEEAAAEVLIKDEVYVGFKDLSKLSPAKFRGLAEAIRADKTLEGKDFYFVESVTLTSVVHKEFHADTGEAAITGTAFGANGKIYVSNGNSSYNAVVCFEPRNLFYYVRPEFGGARSAQTGLTNAQLRILEGSRWTKSQADEISEAVRNVTDAVPGGARIDPSRAKLYLSGKSE